MAQCPSSSVAEAESSPPAFSFASIAGGAQAQARASAHTSSSQAQNKQRTEPKGGFPLPGGGEKPGLGGRKKSFRWELLRKNLSFTAQLMKQRKMKTQARMTTKMAECSLLTTMV